MCVFVVYSCNQDTPPQTPRSFVPPLTHTLSHTHTHTHTHQGHGNDLFDSDSNTGNNDPEYNNTDGRDIVKGRGQLQVRFFALL